MLISTQTILAAWTWYSSISVILH